jgi:serine phosphatase RsbU (regulator of sigma subunit)/anti-sigma regulatory factor (Ser/Thr protein kinase)
VNKDGVPYQYVAICTDISDRYRAEQQLALSRARELEIGAAIQHRLLFGAPPARLVGVAVACYTEASQGVDGDFYTFTRLSSSAFEVLAGDVMGKGVTAALIAAGVKSAYLRQLSELMAKRQGANPPSPATLVNAIHAAVTPELINVGSFVTLSLLRFDRKALTVTWVNAGHTPTLLARAGGQEVIELLGENLPLGVLEEEHYVEHVTHLGIGDTLLNYSDGLSESVNEENIQYGTERIKRILGLGQRALAAPSITLNSLRSEIHDYTHSTSDCDDRTGIIVQIRPVRKPPRGSVTGRRAAEYLDIPRQLDKLGPLRQRIAALGAEQPEEIVQPLVLAAFEAATNIIRHTPEKLTAAPLTALLCRDAGTLSVELVYEGKPFAPPSNLEPDFSGDSEGGFGLYIIENSVDKIEYGAPMPGMVSIRLVKNLAGTVA